MKQKWLLITFCFFCILVASLDSYAKTVPMPWVHSVVYINNMSTQQAGTGFLVSRIIDKDSLKVFLVSNKHVLMPKSIEQDEPNKGVNKEAKAKVFLNKEEKGKITIHEINIILRDESGQDMWRGHHDPNVDVACLDFSPYIWEKGETVQKGLKIGFIEEDRFATKELLERYFVTIGDQIISLGYPLNLVEGGHSFPIARGGTISSWPTMPFKKLPIILIDSTMIRGSSGSPVFLPELPYKYSSETKISVGRIRQAYLLGIQGQLIPDWKIIVQKTVTFGQPMEEINVIDTANFGIFYKAETISETIDRLGISRWIEQDAKEQKE